MKSQRPTREFERLVRSVEDAQACRFVTPARLEANPGKGYGKSSDPNRGILPCTPIRHAPERAKRDWYGSASAAPAPTDARPLDVAWGSSNKYAGAEMQKATSQITLRLSEMDDHFAICRLNSTSEIPFWAREGGFYSFTRTNDELSVVCRQEDVPPGITCERDWVCLKVEGPLSFEMTGIMASIAGPLAEAGISIFTIGTYETDYILIKKERYEEAVGVLSARGHEVKRLANDAESNV